MSMSMSIFGFRRWALTSTIHISLKAQPPRLHNILSRPITSSATMPPAKSITIITAPYHVGIPNTGVGNGPTSLLNAGLVNTLASQGLKVHTIELEPVDDFEGEIGRSFELLRRTSKTVTQVLDAGSFPIVLAGNCHTTVGVAAGIAGSQANKDKKDSLGCVWFDAHDDFNTPDALASGYFDSMGVVMLANLCWQTLLSSIPHFQPMDLSSKLIHVGMRDVTALERSRVLEAGFSVIWGSETSEVDFAGQLSSALSERDPETAMVHLDLDSLDTSVGVANKFAAGGGLVEEDLEGCLEVVARGTRVVSLTVASFDPAFDEGGRIPGVAVKAVGEFVRRLRSKGVIE